MKIKLIIFVLLTGITANAQTILTIAGQTYTNSADTWLGVNIARSVPTTFVFKNNSITSVNRYGYMLQAGDEAPASSNNNLDGAVITGNKFNWSGSDMTVIPHGLFTGHNSNVIAKYNYLNNVPMGIVRKSGNNMSNTGGGVAYNIVKGGLVGMVIKGMSNVNVYNNTFYTDRTTSQTWRPLLHIYTNDDGDRYSVAHGTKIYNNIFYTKYQTFSITIDDTESLNGLECDYNVYWCETGSPRFYINGSIKTFAQWQAMGYDAHSVVVNPNFKDLVTFVPSSRLNYGTNLGSSWLNGLATDAVWGTTDPKTAAQNGTWQVGAIVYGDVTPPVIAAPVYVSSAVNNSSPSVLEITYNSTLATILPAVSAFSVMVNSVDRTINSFNISGTKILLTLLSPVKYGDIVTVTYIKPTASPLQNSSGGQAESINNQQVSNNINPAPPVYISSVIENSDPSKVEIIFSLPLASVIPASSAFSTSINGNVKTVKSVSVTSNKVSLILADSLGHGDVVTVSYSKPAVNPLQAITGATAETITSQPVTNKVLGVPPQVPDTAVKDISVYPNPATEHVFITNLGSKLPQILKIYDFSGKIYLEKILDGINSMIPINLASGVYILHLEVASVLVHIQKLVVIK